MKLGFSLKLNLFSSILVLSYLIACSPVKFSSSCKNNETQCNENMLHYNYETIVSGSKVDILIINDNSASMSYDQSFLAYRFSNFISALELRNVDYRIGIATTDIQSSDNEPRAINKNGALQDGNLIQLEDGSYFISRLSGNLTQKSSLFKSGMIRPETTTCESFIRDFVAKHGTSGMAGEKYKKLYHENCPSNDERGIYAANLAVKKNPGYFIRTDANLALIFISDEDERSQYYDPYYGIQDYGLEKLDTPVSLITNVITTYSSKHLTVHSIIVKDAACKSIQDGQMAGLIGASYGNQYALASKLTGGVIGDICATDKNYTDQLGTIAGSVSNRVRSIGLKCKAPKNLEVKASGNPSYDLYDYELRFRYSLPIGTKIQLSYDCPPT